MAGKVVHRENSDCNLKVIDKTAKNKFRWAWLERCVTLTLRDSSGKLTKSDFILGDFIRKVDKDGVALCVICDTFISYASRGASALDGHCLKQKHCLKVSIGKTNSTMDSFVDTKKTNEPTESYGLHPLMSTTKKSDESTLRPLVPMCDRVSNSEGMVLGFIAEHSLPLSMAPSLINLAVSLSQDKASLTNVSLGRHCASYKMTHGMARTFTEEMVENLRTVPFSLNIDESTSNNNKKILAVLVSYFLPSEGMTRVEHLKSLELVRVDSESVFNAIDTLFHDLNIPWDNLVSVLMDSCNVMRGSKSGVEVKLRSKAAQLLDIDGDSCHHIHNACRKFLEPFDRWVEGLLNDLFNDFKWSSDLKDWLSEICEILHIKYTTPERFVSTRWLSVLDVSLSTKMLLDSYTTLYFGFLPEAEKDLYKEVVEGVFEERSISREGRIRVLEIHKSLTKKWKTLTSDGKNRKTRIHEKIFFEGKKTKLIMNFTIAALPLLQQYVKVFQSKDTLIHQLHDRQLETFKSFLVCFVKSEAIDGLSAKKLKCLALTEDEGQFLSLKEMFVGPDVYKIMKESRRDDPVVVKFLKTAATAYIQCASYMQEKLPLNKDLLRCLSAIDPLARGHSVTASVLRKLGDLMEHFLTEELQSSLHHEVLAYQVDSKLPVYNEEVGIAKWWGEVSKLSRYPALSKLAAVSMSIFHGPQVESSFNLMGDVMDPKSSRLNVETFSAIQTVKYSFLSKKTSSIGYFNRPEPKFSPVNRKLCRNLRSAASLHKKTSEKNAEARRQFQDRLKLDKAKKMSRVKEKLAAKREVEQSKEKHMARQAKASRKRILQKMAEKCQKKRKVCQ